jgi:hypothetical protein
MLNKRYLLNISIIFLFFSCARQIGPNGGPEDKIPPDVIKTNPSVGATNCPVKGTVTFVFSEWLEKKSAQTCVSVFPVPKKGVKINVSGKTLGIKPVTAFAESTTYHIEFNTTLKDLHNNTISSPYHFYFSTGKSIDSGKISGCVVENEPVPNQPKISLFSITNGNWHDSTYFGTPAYLTQADSTGSFTFNYIRKGHYAIVAFVDVNNDNMLQPGTEKTFAPLSRNISTDLSGDPLFLYPVVSDTIKNRIILLKQLSKNVIMGSWLKIPDTISQAALSVWNLKRTGDTPGVCNIKEYSPIPKTARFFITLSDTLCKAVYRMRYSALAMNPKDSSSRPDSLKFEGAILHDTTAPKVTGFLPLGTSGLKPDIKLAWSEPVTSKASRGVMIDTTGDTVPFSINTRLCDTTFISIKQSLNPDKSYKIYFSDSNFSDACGNHPTDSMFGAYTVKTISSENICYSMSGKAACLSKTQDAKWIYMPFNTCEQYIVNDSSGHFRFDSLPSGKGRLGYFIDCNHDNSPTAGRIVPWIQPEPYMIFPDTVEARARWDIEGIEISACEPCLHKKKTEKTEPDNRNKRSGKGDLLKNRK